MTRNAYYRNISIIIVSCSISILGCRRNDPDKQERERLTREFLTAQKQFNQKFREIREVDFPFCNKVYEYFVTYFDNTDSDMKLLLLLDGKMPPEVTISNIRGNNIIRKADKKDNIMMINLLKIERGPGNRATFLIDMIRGKLRAKKITLTMEKKNGEWTFVSKLMSIT